MIARLLRRAAIRAIQGALWLLDADHRSREEIAPDDIKKFTHVQPHDFRSDFGRVRAAFRTVPYAAWELRTTTKTLVAADRHRVIREDRAAAWLEDLKPGDRLLTEAGVEPVVSCRPLGVRVHMYCVEVETDDPADPNNHLLYTDGILSHNTTVATAYLLWSAMFKPDQTILICANKYDMALEIMHRIRFAYENLPNHIRAGVVEYNKGSITFDNGSRIVSRATSKDAARGLSVSLCFVDEFAFVPPNKAKEFWVSIRPTLATGGRCIITSTPMNDEDEFAKIWRLALDVTDEFGNPRPGGVGKNGFKALQYPWWNHPERDEAWAEQERNSIGEAKFRQEHCTDFVSDDETLVDALCLLRLKASEPVFYTETVRWFSDPLPNRAYLVALDPSMGTGADNAALQVFRLPDMEQVAEWQHNRTVPRDQVRVLMQTLLYLDATLRESRLQIGEPEIYWTVENNSIGEAILQIIEDTGEERFPGLFVAERRRKGTARGRFRKGLTTTHQRKLSACARLKSLVESDRCGIRSGALLRELKVFVKKETSYGAKPGEHDDLVSALLLVVRMLDIVIWIGADAGDLNERIADEELGEGDPMPVVF